MGRPLCSGPPGHRFHRERPACGNVLPHHPLCRFGPAGRYQALRLELGSNARHGRNWWCVLYPGLCRTACGGYARPEENDLVCGQYVLRFKCVEWWQQLTAGREERVIL